ncbi:MAG: hypothetical protein P8Y53_13380 [Pseudolabrys sp.]
MNKLKEKRTFERPSLLAVINYDGTHALVFPCRRVVGGWVKAETRARLDIRPTHWRHWRSNATA